jgi:hypothetical protein
MHLDALSGDDAIEFGKGLYETSALQRLLPSSAHAPGARQSKSVHASL